MRSRNLLARSPLPLISQPGKLRPAAPCRVKRRRGGFARGQDRTLLYLLILAGLYVLAGTIEALVR